MRVPLSCSAKCIDILVMKPQADIVFSICRPVSFQNSGIIPAINAGSRGLDILRYRINTIEKNSLQTQIKTRPTPLLKSSRD